MGVQEGEKQIVLLGVLGIFQEDVLDGKKRN